MAKVCKLKRAYMAFLAVSFMIFNVGAATAYFYNITYSCKDNICIEGQIAIWHVSIFNNGENEVEYTAIELLETVNDSIFASLVIPFFPLSDNRGELIILKPNEKVSVNITGVLPKANFLQSLIYYPCFTTTITDAYTIARDDKYESRHCYKTNETMPVVRCVSDNNCDNNEFCRFNSCLKLACKSCQFIKNHACADFECCGSGQCMLDEVCMNNTCQKLSCKSNEYSLNHTCFALNCAFDEAIIKNTCRKLNCSFDEFASNHTCAKLNCSENEIIMNRTCKPLQCRENEYAKSHNCLQLSCSGNESIFNHTCKPLDCYFFQNAANHSCTNNKSIIFKLSLEFIIIMAIILFFIIDFRKYGEKQNKGN